MMISAFMLSRDDDQHAVMRPGYISRSCSRCLPCNFISKGVKDARDMMESFDPRCLLDPKFERGYDNGEPRCFDSAVAVNIHSNDLAVASYEDASRIELTHKS